MPITSNKSFFDWGEVFHDPVLDLTRQDIVRLRRWIIEKPAIRKTASPQPVPSAPHVQALFKAKSRVSEHMPSTPLNSTQVGPM